MSGSKISKEKNSIKEVKQSYAAIDGLRAFSAIGIVLMHMRSGMNNHYDIEGVLFNTIISFFTNFVFLFMLISAFCMCCGYYEKIKNNEISMSGFYKRRYEKIWPFFAILVLMDIIISPSLESLMEVFANLTLCFGLLPNANISVIGVGWYIGIVFLFYMLFPFFCFLLHSKKRAWLVLVISILFNIVCDKYFMDANHVVATFSLRTNILYSSMFFVAGGLIYLYRERLQRFVNAHRKITLVGIIAMVALYFSLENKVIVWNDIDTIWMLLMFSLFLIYAIGVESNILSNRFTKFLASISMEIYLSHMMIFRILEKLHLNYLFGEGWLSYIATVCMVLVGTIAFSICVQKILNVLLKQKFMIDKME